MRAGSLPRRAVLMTDELRPAAFPSPQSVRSARRYFAAAAEASDGLSLRALYGIALSAAFLARVSKSRVEAEGADAGDLGPLAEKRLLQVYGAKAGAERAGVVKAALEAAAKAKK